MTRSRVAGSTIPAEPAGWAVTHIRGCSSSTPRCSSCDHLHSLETCARREWATNSETALVGYSTRRPTFERSLPIGRICMPRDRHRPQGRAVRSCAARHRLASPVGWVTRARRLRLARDCRLPSRCGGRPRNEPRCRARSVPGVRTLPPATSAWPADARLIARASRVLPLVCSEVGELLRNAGSAGARSGLEVRFRSG